MNLAAQMKQVHSAATAAASGLATVITGPQTVEIGEYPIPRPGPGQVGICLEGCGVCASNIPVWEGRPWFDYPLAPGAPGHEGWGVIHAVGRRVRGLREGDRVACISGHAYAQFDVADAGAVSIIPKSLSETPLPAEPLACAVNVMRRADISAGERVAVIGIGFLGALLVQLASAAGAEVIAVSRRRSSLEVARACGAVEAIALNEPHELAQAVADACGSAEFSRVIEATGTQAGLDAAAELVATRGRLVIAGYHQDGVRQVNMQQWNWRGIDVINAHERHDEVYREGMEIALEKTAAGELNPGPLLTHRFSLAELATALEFAARRPEGFMKAYVTCDQQRKESR